jgi:hypothetical protein
MGLIFWSFESIPWTSAYRSLWFWIPYQAMSRADIKMAEDFRLKNIHFPQLPWKTSVLCRPGGLEGLNDAVEISVHLTIKHISARKTAENLRQKLTHGIQEDKWALWGYDDSAAPQLIQEWAASLPFSVPRALHHRFCSTPANPHTQDEVEEAKQSTLSNRYILSTDKYSSPPRSSKSTPPFLNPFHQVSGPRDLG